MTVLAIVASVEAVRAESTSAGYTFVLPLAVDDEVSVFVLRIKKAPEQKIQQRQRRPNPERRETKRSRWGKQLPIGPITMNPEIANKTAAKSSPTPVLTPNHRADANDGEQETGKTITAGEREYRAGNGSKQFKHVTSHCPG